MIKPIKKPSRGKLLISEPFLADPHFKRSVILLSEHNAEGTVGFILNKPTELVFNDAVKDFPDFDAIIYYGGPVQTDYLQYIHRLGDKLTGSKEIIKGVYWGGDFEVLRLLVDTRQIDPSDIRFFVGYSGWSPDQLTEEIKQKSWILASATNDFPFADNPKSLWSHALRGMGKEFAILANFPEDPSMN